MANYHTMKKDELIKVLKERDEELDSARKTIAERDSKINGLIRDCEGMTEECNNLRNKVNGLTDDLKKSNETCERLNKEKDALRVEKNAVKTTVEQKEEIISTLKHQRAIIGIITIAAILIAIIF